MPRTGPSMPSAGTDRPAVPRRQWLGLVLRALTLVAAAVFLARGVHWHDVAATARRAGLVAPSLVLALNACMMGLRSIRTRILLQRRISLTASFLVRLTSSALNNLTPFRGGDVARLWMLERESGVTKSGAAAIAMVENLVETVALAGMAFAASFFVAGQRWAMVSAPWVLGLAIGALAVLKAATGRAARTLACRPDQVDAPTRLRRWLRQLEPGVRALSDPGVPTLALLLSLLALACETLMIFLCAMSMGIEISLPLAAVVLLGINLALVLPSTPAGAGPFEGATVAVLMLAGIAKGPAVAFALFYHALQVIPVTVAGATILLMAKRRGAGGLPGLATPVPSPERAKLGA